MGVAYIFVTLESSIAINFVEEITAYKVLILNDILVVNLENTKMESSAIVDYLQ